MLPWATRGADALVRWLDDYLQEHAVRRDEYREVLSRLDVLEERIGQLEQRIDQRFEKVDQRFERLEERVDQQGHEINARIDRLHDAMRVQTRWTIGTIALFGTIVTVLLAVAEFAG